MKCKCGSYAINHDHHDRDGSDPHLCDVCYWRVRADGLLEALKIAREFAAYAQAEPDDLALIDAAIAKATGSGHD